MYASLVTMNTLSVEECLVSGRQRQRRRAVCSAGWAGGVGHGGGGNERHPVPDVTGAATEDDREVRGADRRHHHGGGHPQRVQRGSSGGLPRHRSVLSLCLPGLPCHRSVLSL